MPRIYKLKYIVALSLVLAAFVMLSACGKDGDGDGSMTLAEYKVEFIVNDTAAYFIKTSGNSMLEMPPIPEKAGFIFSGWYWDKGTWLIPFAADSLVGTTLTSDIRIYAKFNILVGGESGNTPVESNVQQILYSDPGIYKTTGTVVGVNDRSFLLSDSTATVLVYKGSAWTPDVKVGDAVVLEGSTVVDCKAVQFDLDTVYTVLSSDNSVNYPTASELSSGALDFINKSTTLKPEYVRVTGTVQKSGNAYSICISGTDILCNITYPTAEQAELLSALADRSVVAIGYITGKSAKSLNLFMLSVDE